MTSLPHPVASRTTHAIAALYGHEDDTLIAWQRACAQAAETRRGQHDEDRLRKALTLAQDGHVTLKDDGYATVNSSGKPYTVQADGSCTCPDFERRRVTCKHALASATPGSLESAVGAGGTAGGSPAGSRTAEGVDPTTSAQPAHGAPFGGVGRA